MIEFNYTYDVINNIPIHTIGCLLSRNDGINFAKTLTDKNSVIVNTCYFVEQRAKENILIIDLIKKLYPEHKIYILGCGVKQLKEIYKDCICIDNKELNILIKDQKSKSVNNKVSIKIQDGCLNNCSFCIIHKLRNYLYSKPYADIKRNIDEELKDIDYINLELNGIELTNYKDKEYSLTLSSMIEDLILTYKEKLHSVSLGMSIDPNSDETLKIIQLASKYNQIITPVFLAAQSCDDRVLKAMRRRHNVKQFREVLDLAKSLNVSTSWELIVGFPEEDNEQFKNTLDFVKEYKPAALSIFPYSPREGTDAYDMLQVPEDIKKCRVKMLYDQLDVYKQHKHDINVSFSLDKYKHDFKKVFFENNFVRFKFDINSIKEIVDQINNTNKDVILVFDYKTEEDKIYINFFKEFMPNIYRVVKSKTIEEKELFENQFHCIAS